jgi:hypothetical protein
LQQTGPLFGHEPYKHWKITKLNRNTRWMKYNKNKINIAYYCFLPSMNQNDNNNFQVLLQHFCCKNEEE